MSSNSNISISGLLRSVKSKGFTIQGALNELIDNSLDASASIVRISFDTRENVLVVADNGAGMTKSVADVSYRIHNDKAATNKNGLYGIGKTVAEGMLSNQVATTTTLTRSKDERLLEITAEWSESIRTDSWNPRAAGASADFGVPTWDKYAIDSSQGTVVFIPMPSEMMLKMVETIDANVRAICYAYEEQENCKIEILVNGVKQNDDYSDALGWNRVTLDQHRTKVPIEVWTKDGEHRVYHVENEMKVGFNYDARKTDGKPIDSLQAPRLDDYNEIRNAGYRLTAEMSLRCVYNPRFNPSGTVDDAGNLQRDPMVRGFLSFRRGGRHLAQIPCDPPVSGDMERRRVIGSIRSSLDYTYQADPLINTEGNKSNVTKSNIDQTLFKTVKDIARKWGDTYYKLHVKPALIVARNPRVPSEKVDQFKLGYSDPVWRAHYEQFLNDNPIDW
jgi:hypothetical protein